MRRIAILAVAACHCVGHGAATPVSRETTLYVATSGDDRAAGTMGAPLATLARARDVARSLHVKDVVVRGGTYFLAAPLVLSREDSGLSINASPNERVVLSGGVRITGLAQSEVNGRRTWATVVPDVKEGRWWFRELFVNGQRRARTRIPKEGYFHPAELPDVNPSGSFGKDSSWLEGQKRFRFAPGDLNGSWTNLGDVEVVALHFWIDSRMPIASVDDKERLVTFTRASGFRLTEKFEATPLARYYVENVAEALDTPGQWYLNRATGVLTYLPRPGEELATTTEIIAPRLAQLVRLEDVDHVRLRGLELRHAESNRGRSEIGALQAAVDVGGAISASGARDSTFEDLTIANVGSWGIQLGAGCERDRIVRCDIGDLGAGGIRIGEEKLGGADADHDAITDCHIHDGGHIYRSAVGVWIGQSAGNLIAHNHVHDFDYSGISVGWTWGYKASGAKENVIEKNHVHDVGRGVLSDLAGIYTLGPSPGTVIRNNVIHDVSDHAYGGWGIYFDEGTTGVVAERNVVFRTQSGGFFQNYGEHNVVANNVFALSREGQLVRGEEVGSISFERNIVYFREGELLAWNWTSDGFAFDRNVYWNASGREPAFAGATLADWRRRGMDLHSIIADPLFVDPEHGDFSLRAGSPARGVGFEPIDVRDVGPRR